MDASENRDKAPAPLEPRISSYKRSLRVSVPAAAVSHITAYLIAAAAIIWEICELNWVPGRFAALVAQISQTHSGQGATKITLLTGGDFNWFWATGKALGQGLDADFYDPAAFSPLLRGLLHYDPGGTILLVYPPLVLPLFSAFALVPLALSYTAYCTLSLLISAFLLRFAGFPWWCILLGLISPAASTWLYGGQLDLICGAILVYGLSRVECAPGFAGLALSLLVLKPQFTLLVPVAVLARGQWKAVLTGTLGVAFFAAISLAYWRNASWTAFLHEGQANMGALLEAPFIYGAAHPADYDFQFSGISVFWMLRSLHLGLPIAYAAQGAATLMAIGAAWLVWRHPAIMLQRRLIFTVLLVPFTSPYGFTGSLCMYSTVLPLLARRDTPWRNAILAWLWAAPGLGFGIAKAHHILIGPLLVLAALVLCFEWRLPADSVEKVLVSANSRNTVR
jgi:alpha-1,2-mannosyltransferase